MLFLDELNSKFLLNLRCTVQSIRESGWEILIKAVKNSLMLPTSNELIPFESAQPAFEVKLI